MNETYNDDFDAEKKTSNKSGGHKVKKVLGTAFLACLFGVVAAFAFKGTNILIENMSKEPEKVIVEDVAPENEEPAEENLIKEKNVNIGNNENEKDSDDKKNTSLMNINTGYNTVSKVAEDVMPSIVAITNKSVQEVISWYGMGVQEYEAESAGSGIIIGKDDNEFLIATNAHVVKGAQTLTVCFIDESVSKATIKGTDECNDLAVISVSVEDIDVSTLDKIKVAVLGDSDELKIGEQVVAIGNALGYGQSVTTGIVSALARDITDDGLDNPLIQTDAAINPGNSGGALLNMNGELIGINSAKLANTKVEGMGYAIPIAAAEPIMENLLSMANREKVDPSEAGYIGISGFSVTSDVSKQYGIPVGIYVSEVTNGAAAHRAGIKKGDVITAFDGMRLDSINKLREKLDYYKAGEVVEVTVQRTDDGEYSEMKIDVTLDGRKGTPLDEAYSEKSEESDFDSEGDNKNDQNEEKQVPRNFNDFYNGDGRSIFDIFGY